jgi:hypothetical protein
MRHRRFYADAKREVRDLGMVLKRTEFDDFRVTFRGERDPDAGYFANDLDDAVDTAWAMFEERCANLGNPERRPL